MQSSSRDYISVSDLYNKLIQKHASLNSGNSSNHFIIQDIQGFKKNYQNWCLDDVKFLTDNPDQFKIIIALSFFENLRLVSEANNAKAVEDLCLLLKAECDSKSASEKNYFISSNDFFNNWEINIKETRKQIFLFVMTNYYQHGITHDLLDVIRILGCIGIAEKYSVNVEPFERLKKVNIEDFFMSISHRNQHAFKFPTDSIKSLRNFCGTLAAEFGKGASGQAAAAEKFLENFKALFHSDLCHASHACVLIHVLYNEKSLAAFIVLLGCFDQIDQHAYSNHVLEKMYSILNRAQTWGTPALNNTRFLMEYDLSQYLPKLDSFVAAQIGDNPFSANQIKLLKLLCPDMQSLGAGQDDCKDTIKQYLETRSVNFRPIKLKPNSSKSSSKQLIDSGISSRANDTCISSISACIFGASDQVLANNTTVTPAGKKEVYRTRTV